MWFIATHAVVIFPLQWNSWVRFTCPVHVFLDSRNNLIFFCYGIMYPLFGVLHKMRVQHMTHDHPRLCRKHMPMMISLFNIIRYLDNIVPVNKLNFITYVCTTLDIMLTEEHISANKIKAVRSIK